MKRFNSARRPNCSKIYVAFFVGALFCFNLAIAQDDSDVRGMVQQLEQLRDAGKYQEAVPIAEKVMKYCEKKYGPEHPEVADSLNDLASLYGPMGQQAKAVPLYERALKIREKALGHEHPYVAIILNNLAETYREMGDYAKAEPLYKRAVKIFETKLGPTHQNTAACLSNLALLYEAKGEMAKVEPLYARALKIREENLGPDNPAVANSLGNLAALYYRQGKFAQAVPEFQIALTFAQTSSYDVIRQETVIHALRAMGTAYWHTRNYKEAQQWFLKAQAVQRKSGKVWVGTLDAEVERVKALAASQP